MKQPIFSPLPAGPFACIVADPPWDYSRKLSGGGTSGFSPVHHSRGGSRGAANHYSTLTLDELCRLQVRDVAADAAHLYLWTTGTFVVEAHELAAAWGFTPKGLIPWIKTTKDGATRVMAAGGDPAAAVRMGMGLYLRWCTEFVVFGVRGKLPTLRNDARGLMFAPQGKHSEKPDDFYRFVETVSPGPRLELFARKCRPGYDAWGDEVADD